MRHLRILLSGSNGFIGRALFSVLKKEGHQVIRLVRSKEQRGEDCIVWNPALGEVDPELLEGFDAVIHLAGASLGKGRWTAKKKEAVFLSRCRDTWLLSHALARLKKLPQVLLCASAIGYYGNAGEQILTEESPKGSGFLADLCSKWEAATKSLESKGVRTVHMRFGAVLGKEGGLLRKLLPIYRLGLGGKLGSGNQYMSWIAIQDLTSFVLSMLKHEEISGVFNFVSPEPVRQKEFADLLARSLHRTAFFPVPAFLLRLIFGEMADEVLLASARVLPKRLLEAGFSFRYPTLDSFLRDNL